MKTEVLRVHVDGTTEPFNTDIDTTIKTMFDEKGINFVCGMLYHAIFDILSNYLDDFVIDDRVVDICFTDTDYRMCVSPDIIFIARDLFNYWVKIGSCVVEEIPEKKVGKSIIQLKVARAKDVFMFGVEHRVLSKYTEFFYKLGNIWETKIYENI